MEMTDPRVFIAAIYLMTTATAEASETVADRMISQTDYSAAAWAGKYAAAERRQDMEKMTEAAFRRLLLKRYEKAKWERFAALLETTAETAENPALAAEYAGAAADVLRRTIENTSPLAWRIADQPDFGFSEEIYGRFSALENDSNSDER